MRLVRLAGALAVLLTLAGCEDDRVRLAFAPEIGDELTYRTVVETATERRLGDDPAGRTDGRDTFESVQVVRDVGETITLEVVITRPGADPRALDVTVDRGAVLTALDLAEGVPLTVLGSAVATSLPSGALSPPDRALELGTTWTIDTTTTAARRVRGQGQLRSVGVEDGREVARTRIEISVPVTQEIEADGSRVTLAGAQQVVVDNVVDLADGSLVRTDVRSEGTLAATVFPPPGVVAEPVDGTISFVVRARTERAG